MTTLTLPLIGGGSESYAMRAPGGWARPDGPIGVRTAYAAAHVVADPLSDTAPGAPAVLDWESTLAFRRHLWSWGLGVADAMDTAQRGAGLNWETTKELISRSAAEAKACSGLLACGAGTDHREDLDSIEDVIAAYTEQIEHIESSGANVIVMASRHLARLASGPDDYAKVYGRLLGQVSRPVILHWLGPMFDPALTGYWGSADVTEATATMLAIIGDHADAVDGVKISLLDADHERSVRAQLPAGVRLYTGDDFNYPELIEGDAGSHSHALLGIFDAIAPAASAALQALERGDTATYHQILAPTVPLARHLFAAPTYYYKTGIVFLSWLAGHQPAFSMVGGLATGRGLPHLLTAFRLADEAGLLPDPELAADRLRRVLAVAGISA